MADAFEPGDVVQLKSGGPIMTVETTSEDRVWASWFAYGKRHRQRFPIASLQRTIARQGRPVGATPCQCASN